MRRGHPLRWATLALVTAAAGLLSTVVWVVATSTGALVPATPWATIAVLVALGVGVLTFAWPVRMHVQGRSKKPLDRLRAARVLVLAQAGALTGAAATGWHLGQIAVLLRDIDLVANRGPALRVGLALVCSILLLAAGMLAQHWCRLPAQSDDERTDEDVVAA